MGQQTNEEPGLSFILKGFDELIRNLERIRFQVDDNLLQAVAVEAETVSTNSKDKFVPVDLGTLKNSIHVSEVRRVSFGREGALIVAKIVAGGPAIDYAIVIHEYPDHQPPSWVGVAVQFSPEGRGPKYLYIPLMQQVKGMDQRVAEFVSSALN